MLLIQPKAVACYCTRRNFRTRKNFVLWRSRAFVRYKFRTAGTVSHTLLYVHGFSITKFRTFSRKYEMYEIKSRTKISSIPVFKKICSIQQYSIIRKYSNNSFQPYALQSVTHKCGLDEQTNTEVPDSRRVTVTYTDRVLQLHTKTGFKGITVQAKVGTAIRLLDDCHKNDMKSIRSH